MADPDARHLAGRHAVVTGGGRGIGAAIAEELARLGAVLTLLGRSAEVLEQQARQLEERYDARVVTEVCDVSDAAMVAEAFAAARQRLGDPHVLVNNAGIAEASPLAETSLELWNRAIGVNLTGTFLCSRAVIEGMLRRGWGRIINIASVAGLHGRGRITAYSAAKHGVVGFTRALAHEVAKRGVTVNALCPGYADTAMAERAAQNLASALGKSDDEARGMLVRSLPIGRFVDPVEVARLAGWLCSPEAAAVTGTAIPLGGEG